MGQLLRGVKGRFSDIVENGLLRKQDCAIVSGAAHSNMPGGNDAEHNRQKPTDIAGACGPL
jgi:hypothetical protein